MPHAQCPRLLVVRLTEPVDRGRLQLAGVEAEAAVGRRVLGQERLRHEPAHVHERDLAHADELIDAGVPPGELPVGQFQRELAQRLATLAEERVDTVEAEERLRDLGPGMDRLAE